MVLRLCVTSITALVASQILVGVSAKKFLADDHEDFDDFEDSEHQE